MLAKNQRKDTRCNHCGKFLSRYSGQHFEYNPNADYYCSPECNHKQIDKRNKEDTK